MPVRNNPGATFCPHRGQSAEPSAASPQTFRTPPISCPLPTV